MADTTIPTPPQQPADWAMAEAPAAPRSDKKNATKAAPSSKGLPAPREIDKLVALYQQRRFAEAQALARSLTLRFPRYAYGWKILGAALLAQGQHAQALLPMQTAAELSPEDAETHRNLGIARKMNGRLAEAEASCRRALEIAPADAKAHNHLGIVLKEQGRFIEAEVHYRRAVELTPTYVDGHSNLGSVLQVQGRLPEAEASLRQTLALKPDDAGSHSALLFCMSQNEAVDAAALFAEYCRFGAQFEAPLRAQWQPHSNSREPERCLQVGFVSADLRNHAVASFLEPVLLHLATYASLSLHAYANHRTDDSVTQRLRGYVKHWHPVAGLSDAALAEKIRADGIDILFDLSNHTGHNRLLAFARKPAPVQISWIGYHGTTGLSGMDYYLTDRFLLPPGQFDHQFTEKLVHLPAGAPFLPSAEAPPVNDLPALGNGYLTFGSFNRPSKLSRTVIALWSQLLRAAPTSRMVLGAMLPDGQYDTLTAWFAGEGIARERLDFHPHSSMQDYLALHHQVDACLDTFPYAGGTTTFHALWMGVPTLTLAGSTIAGRTGAGILGHVGLDAFVAQDAVAFVRQGLSLAADDFSALARLRAGLRERFAQSAPGQPALIAASLERALRTMWQRWCAGLPTGSFEISMADMTVSTPPQQSADPAMAPCNALTQPVAAAASKSIAIVSATRLSENDFWSHSALGLSLKRHLQRDARLSVDIAFENARGLSVLFNDCIDQAEDDAILVFIHDDVWIDEANFSDAVIAGLENFDVIGVAGNRRRVPGQPAWAFIDAQFTWDDKSNLSGHVAHGKNAFGQISDFGAVPAECELLDGVFLATKKTSLKLNKVRFDARFDFHFYDMDFCRSARKAGLRLGTWPVKLTHQSGGAFGSPHWTEKYQCYLNKWETACENGDMTILPHEIADKEQELQKAINEALQTALQHQTAGQLEQAEYICLDILKMQPKHAAANHALGRMEIDLKGALAALPRLEMAVMENPGNEQFWVSYIGALMQSRPADIVAEAIELGLKYGLRAETAQRLTADFVKELESQASRNILANEKHGAINQTPVHEHHNPDLLRVIPECAEFVIEIGCSSGALAREFKKIKPDCSYFGVDIDSQYTLLADRYCDRTAAIDIEESGNDFFIEHQHRDCWVFGDTLEHFRDPWKILRKVRAVIPAQGCVVACIPNAQHWSVQVKLGVGDFRYQDSGLLDRTHLRWFTRQTIMELFAETGFDVIECSPRIFNEPAREKFLPLIGNMAQSAGFDSAMAINDALPLQYVIKAIPR